MRHFQGFTEREMTFGKIPIACTVYSATLLAFLGACALAEAAQDCQQPKTGTSEAPIISPPIKEVVKGKGNVQFYSAPNYHCVMKGVFAVPQDKLLTQAQTEDGWSSVTYANPKTGDNVSGWVRSVRLKEPTAAGSKFAPAPVQ
jgi:hypothetical protein